jgi:hypothetical protein
LRESVGLAASRSLKGRDKVSPERGLIVVAVANHGRLEVDPSYNLRDHLRDDLALGPASTQCFLDVGEPQVAMVTNESVSRMVLGMIERHQEPFRPVLVAPIFKVVERVGGSVRVEDVLHIDIGKRAGDQAPQGSPIAQLDGLGTVRTQF